MRKLPTHKELNEAWGLLKNRGRTEWKHHVDIPHEDASKAIAPVIDKFKKIAASCNLEIHREWSNKPNKSLKIVHPLLYGEPEKVNSDVSTYLDVGVTFTSPKKAFKLLVYAEIMDVTKPESEVMVTMYLYRRFRQYGEWEGGYDEESPLLAMSTHRPSYSRKKDTLGEIYVKFNQVAAGIARGNFSEDW